MQLFSFMKDTDLLVGVQRRATENGDWSSCSCTLFRREDHEEIVQQFSSMGKVVAETKKTICLCLGLVRAVWSEQDKMESGAENTPLQTQPSGDDP